MWSSFQANGDMAMTNTDKFQCPFCDAQYDVVRVEAAAAHDKPLLCPSCDAPITTARANLRSNFSA